jgi:hypothetical protein
VRAPAAIADEFGRRARLYASLDRRLSSCTRFFGAAAVTNATFAELFSRPAGRMCIAGHTLEFLLQLGQRLEHLNTGQIGVIEAAAMNAARIDGVMVAIEQSEVQLHLDQLRSADPERHAVAVSQMNRLLSMAHARASPARLFAGAAAYAQVLRAVVAEIGHPVCFMRQHDRECIGRTLITWLRSRS